MERKKYFKDCKKCGIKLRIDEFPIHYDWCCNCLQLHRVCNVCHRGKNILEFDSKEWIELFPNVSHLTCYDCRVKKTSTRYRKKIALEEIKSQMLVQKEILERQQFNEWKWSKWETIESISRLAKISPKQLYFNHREFAECADVYLKVKKIIKKNNENSI